MDVGKAIRELRKQRSWSQEKLARLSNITQAALSQIENGKRPGIETMKQISQALKVPESLIYVQSIERDDIPENKKELYDHLFPIIQQMVTQIAKAD
jgi:transcriptional regulator with XRE-family HTH domain